MPRGELRWRRPLGASLVDQLLHMAPELGLVHAGVAPHEVLLDLDPRRDLDLAVEEGLDLAQRLETLGSAVRKVSHRSVPVP